ncbi:hypothetical protein SapgrDRAFT_1314 [Saprospira grandis DSM 2844]|uniref:Uncharacterized protein n=1 Tax=Saprospira grandis DSM 2844 TaxID=694433 RepID=J0P6D2_9BACT|nr:hypothetical protein SapgrDRAFT_1314 [Saprospira grandis DSM 2844]
MAYKGISVEKNSVSIFKFYFCLNESKKYNTNIHALHIPYFLIDISHDEAKTMGLGPRIAPNGSSRL